MHSADMSSEAKLLRSSIHFRHRTEKCGYENVLARHAQQQFRLPQRRKTRPGVPTFFATSRPHIERLRESFDIPRVKHFATADKQSDGLPSVIGYPCARPSTGLKKPARKSHSPAQDSSQRRPHRRDIYLPTGHECILLSHNKT